MLLSRLAFAMMLLRHVTLTGLFRRRSTIADVTFIFVSIDAALIFITMILAPPLRLLPDTDIYFAFIIAIRSSMYYHYAAAYCRIFAALRLSFIFTPDAPLRRQP